MENKKLNQNNKDQIYEEVDFTAIIYFILKNIRIFIISFLLLTLLSILFAYFSTQEFKVDRSISINKLLDERIAKLNLLSKNVEQGNFPDSFFLSTYFNAITKLTIYESDITKSNFAIKPNKQSVIDYPMEFNFSIISDNVQKSKKIIQKNSNELIEETTSYYLKELNNILSSIEISKSNYSLLIKEQNENYARILEFDKSLGNIKEQDMENLNGFFDEIDNIDIIINEQDTNAITISDLVKYIKSLFELQNSKYQLLNNYSEKFRVLQTKQEVSALLFDFKYIYQELNNLEKETKIFIQNIMSGNYKIFEKNEFEEKIIKKNYKMYTIIGMSISILLSLILIYFIHLRKSILSNKI